MDTSKTHTLTMDEHGAAGKAARLCRPLTRRHDQLTLKITRLTANR